MLFNRKVRVLVDTGPAAVQSQRAQVRRYHQIQRLRPLRYRRLSLLYRGYHFADGKKNVFDSLVLLKRSARKAQKTPTTSGGLQN
jgi:hypothetical protein